MLKGSTVRKNKPNKHQVDYGLKDIYNKYVSYQESKHRQILNYKIFSLIIKEGNKLIRDQILDGETLRMPFIGSLGIVKREAKYNPKTLHKWPVDWVKTKELGYRVYIEQPYFYRFFWYKPNKRLTNKKYYRFVVNRLTKRMIPVAIKNGMDYFTKLDKNGN